jgi:hypothetical protein
MGTLIDDALLEEFAVLAAPDDVAAALKDRYGASIDTVFCTFDLGDEERQLRALRALQS